jgi:hypothetical protein
LAIKTSRAVGGRFARYFAELLNAAARGVAGHKWDSASMGEGRGVGGSLVSLSQVSGQGGRQPSKPISSVRSGWTEGLNVRRFRLPCAPS